MTASTITVPEKPSFFASVEEQALHRAKVVIAFIASMPLTVQALQNDAESLVKLVPELAPFLPELQKLAGELPLLKALAAELVAVSAITVSSPVPADSTTNADGSPKLAA